MALPRGQDGAWKPESTPDAIAELVDFSPGELADLLGDPQRPTPRDCAGRALADRCQAMLFKLEGLDKGTALGLTFSTCDGCH